VINNIALIFIISVVGFFVQVFSTSSFAGNDYTREYHAESIRVLRGSAKMRYSDVGFFGTKVGNVGSRGIPEVIHLGDIITVKDRTVEANIIEVTEHLRDMSYGGKLLAKKGDVTCLIVTRKEDFPRDDVRDRVWIQVEHCRPLR
jgi:hypothetical protein